MLSENPFSIRRTFCEGLSLCSSIPAPDPFPGMAFAVGTLQIGDGELGVMLECIQALMTEHFLDMPTPTTDTRSTDHLLQHP